MRVLIIQTGPLIELVHSLPVSSDLRREFPQLAIDWCVDEKLAGLVRLHPAVDRILPVALSRWRHTSWHVATWREIGHIRRILRAVDYEAVFDLTGNLTSAFIAHQACGPVCGYEPPTRLRRRLAHYDASYLIPNIGHPVERHRWLIAAALELPLEMPLDFGLRAPPLQADWLPAAPYVVFLCSSACTETPWPPDHWAELGKALQARGFSIVLSPVEAEDKICNALVSALPEAHPAPEIPLETLAGMLAGAAGIIGNHCPALHLAAALARPTIAVGSDDDPAAGGILSAAPFRNLGGQGKIPEVAAVLNAFSSPAFSNFSRSWLA